MSVNPQVFSYKFTVGTLIVAFTILAAYSYTSYNSAKLNEDFLKQEKKLLESQISDILSSYDSLGEKNKSLVLELDNAESRIEVTLDSLVRLKADVSLIHKYRNQLTHLRKQQNSLIKKGDSFFGVNQELIKQNASITKVLEEQTSLISVLENEKETLKETLEKGALISANSFEARAYKLKKSGDQTETYKASVINNIKVSFIIAENKLAQNQDKELYIQVIGPDNNIVADKGAITFDEFSLIYSSKIRVNYTSKNLDVIANIEIPEVLQKGKYHINVFENERRLGSTQIDLY
jgi:peptidoglycan hydrolase CwlO-like protein